MWWMADKSGGKKRFARLIWQDHAAIAGLMGLALLNTVSKVALAYAMGWFVDGAVRRNISLVLSAGGVAITSLVAGYGLTVSLAARQLRVTRRIQTTLKRTVYQTVLVPNDQLILDDGWQQVFNLTENSIPTLGNDYFANRLANVGRAIQIGVCSAALLLVNRSLFFWFAGVSAVPFLLNPVIRRQFGRYKVKLNARTMQHMALATAVFGGITTIKAFGAGRQFTTQLQELDGQLEERRRQSMLWDIRIGQLSTVLAMSAQILCMLIAAWFVLRGRITIGALTITTQLLNFIVPAITAYNTAYLISVATLPLQATYQNIVNRQPPQATGVFINGDLVVSHLTYAYPQGTNLFKDFSVAFEKGKRIAVVGPSGCGKSTLMKLISGNLKGYQGQIAIGGQRLTAIAADQLLRNVGYVNQTPVIFTGSVLENVTMFGAIQSSTVGQVMRDLNLEELAHRQVVAGEGSLSGGERQRISLARGLLVAAPILIIDEPDSGQDPETVATIQALIMKLTERTIIVVTHNWQPTYLQQFDQVIRL